MIYCCEIPSLIKPAVPHAAHIVFSTEDVKKAPSLIN